MPTVLLLAGSSTSLLGGSFHPGGAWTTSSFGAGTNAGTSLTATSAGAGIGVYTAANGNKVGYTLWSGGAWSTPAPINASAVAMGQPFIDATGSSSAHVTYQDSTFNFWYLAYTGGTWSAMPQAIGANYGPLPATIAARGVNATIGFIDGQQGSVNDVAAADLNGGTWLARDDIAGPESFKVPAVIVSLSAGPELLMVFAQNNNPQMMFATRTGGVWSSPAALTNCLTNDRPALAPLPNGGAILAFRGTDSPTTGYLYWSVYSASTWSAVAPFATPNESIAGPPAVTHGVGGATAEVAFLDTSGMAHHARLTGSTWSAPVLVGGANLNGVAIASMP
jgi:hypothetical protein